MILINEYDKPITDILEAGKNEKAHEHCRKILRTLYSVVKSSSEHIRFFLDDGHCAFFQNIGVFRFE